MKLKIGLETLINNKWFWVVLYFSIGLIIFTRNIGSPGIDHEESGQFWIANGLNHFSDINEPSGGLNDVFDNNRKANLDPCGFSLLLHFWIGLFGNNIYSLRILPFLFLLITAVFFRKILKLLNFSEWLVNLSPLVLLLSKDIISFGFTIRAYSFEICGGLISLYCLAKYLKYRNNLDLFWLLAILAAFSFSRYGFCIQVATCLFFVIYFNRKHLLHLIKSLPFLFGLGLLISAYILIYNSSFYYHIVQTNFKGPDYSYLKTFKYQSSFLDGLKLVIKNFITLRATPFTLFLLLIITSKLFKRIPSFNKYQFFLHYFIVYTGLSFLISVLGLYPWDVTSRNSLIFQVFSIFSICIILDWFISNKSFFTKMIAIGGFILLLFYLSFKRGYIRGDYSSIMYEEGKNSSVTWVDWMIYPVLKYNIKYGTLKNCKDLHYPILLKDTFNNSYKYLVIDIKPQTEKARLKIYNIKKYRVLKQVENDYLLEILDK